MLLTISTLKILKKKPFENTQDKGENAGNQHYLLFLQCFTHPQKSISVSKLDLFLIQLCDCIQFGPD